MAYVLDSRASLFAGKQQAVMPGMISLRQGLRCLVRRSGRRQEPARGRKVPTGGWRVEVATELGTKTGQEVETRHAKVGETWHPHLLRIVLGGIYTLALTLFQYLSAVAHVAGLSVKSPISLSV